MLDACLFVRIQIAGFIITFIRGVTLTIFCLPKKLGPVQIRMCRRKGLAVAGSALLLLAGCSSLPDSGPTEAQVNRLQHNPKKNTVGYAIVQISPDLLTLLDSEAPPLFSGLATASPTRHGTNDTIGPGDTLQISIYEIGSALFSPSSASAAASSVGGVSTSNASNLPLLNVDGSGNILVPFVGRLHVTGMTTSQVGQAITAQLKQKSQSPQVMVRIASNLTNSVMIYGGVRQPSRIPLTPNQERILDVIALAGGEDNPTRAHEDYTVRLIRNNQIVELPLKTIENDPQQNIIMQPGDRVQLTFQPRIFTVFGASGQVSQAQFTTPTLTMAEAVSRSGGPSDARADPNAVYVFRFENADIVRRLGMPVDQDATTAPVIYQMDMMNPASYFLAQRFMMRDHDLIYIANSASNKFYKFFGLITTILSPGTSMGGLAK